MARKMATIVRTVGEGETAKAVVLTFRRLTVKQEEEYSNWLRKLILKRARESLQATCPSSVWPDALGKIAKEISGSSCSLTGIDGIQNACSGDGMKKFLLLAAQEDHPEIDEETVADLILEDFKACVEVVQELLPVGVKKLEETGDESK